MTTVLAPSRSLADYATRYNAEDRELYRQDIPNSDALEWMDANIPRFSCSDPLLEDIWHYRWWVFRKHIRSVPDGGQFITEFLPDVYWAGPYNSINCADGHHLAEAQWLRDGGELARQDARFWFAGPGDVTSYSTWTVDSVMRYAIAQDDRDFAIGLLDDFVRFYHRVEATNMTSYGLFWSYDDRDAMELSISGSGLRPTLNSYMAANAAAISQIAQWTGRGDLAEEFARKAADLRRLIQELLWDTHASFFKVIPLDDRLGEVEHFDFAHIPAARNVRELLGYIPWMFGLADGANADAWRFLADHEHFGGAVGPTTAERCHPGFMNNPDPHECQWNGPSWPFATTQLLDAMLEALHHDVAGVSKGDFWRELRRYAAIHFRDDDERGRIHWLDEDLDPDSGEWISRRILESWGWRADKGGLERGKDYNHSAFCDLIVRGVAGIRVDDVDGRSVITVAPQVPLGVADGGADGMMGNVADCASVISGGVGVGAGPEVAALQWFRLEHVPVAGHDVTVVFDGDGTHVDVVGGPGLTVIMDGRSYHTGDMTNLRLSLPV